VVYFPGLHDYHEKLTTSSYNAPMYHQVIKILDELGVLQAYPFASSTPTRTKRQPVRVLQPRTRDTHGEITYYLLLVII
jgi:hypothetical protein